MCGRASIITRKKETKGSVNVAPSQLLPVITNEDPEHVQFFSWGLVPHWAKEKAYKHKSINARAETLTGKPTFRQLIQSKCCLVPADSIYEWRTTPSGKVPYRILLKDEGLFASPASGMSRRTPR